MILPVRNGAGAIECQLNALAAQRTRVDWDLLVVDNGSTDDTVSIVQSHPMASQLRVVDASHRPGINVARNAGIREATGDFLVFCDHDDVVDVDWLDAMADAAASFDVVGGGLDEDALNRDLPARRPHFPTDRLPIGLNFLPFAVGANLGVWRHLADELDGFDESFRDGYDDADFCFRAQLAGYTIGFAPDAVVAYRHRAGASDLFRQFKGYGRAEPLVYARYRNQGMDAATPVQVIKRWVRIACWAPSALFSTHARSQLAYTAGYSVGRLQGSIQHRSVYL